MTHPRLRGTWFVVPTPFHEDGSLDLESQRSVVEAAIGWGVDGLTAMGVTSEASALTPDERVRALRAIFEAASGRTPIAVGCSGGSVAAVTSLAGQAGDLGAMAAMVAAPTLGRGIDLLPGFYGEVARRGELPLVIQDEPAATGVTVPVGVLVRCLEASGARTVKLEDPPTPPKIARLLESDPSLGVFGGLGGAFALYELRAGACGTMTGFAFPEILRAVREAHEEGDGHRAAATFDRYLPLIQFEAQPGIGLAVRKELLSRRGAIASGRTRVGPGLDGTTSLSLDDLVARMGIAPDAGRFQPYPVLGPA